MALTRAQLLMGDINNGAILNGQPQGVRPGGAGITIRTDGVIEVDSGTIVGVMKLAPTAAVAATKYNAYTWPATPGAAGQQLETDGLGGLSWADSDGIDWTQKGQLLVGTGIGTDILLNAGSNTSFLLADTNTPSGLVYSNNSTSAALMPAGNTGARPNPATPGQIRYNTGTGKFEFATGATSWEEIASGDPTVSTFVVQTVPVPGETASALIPAGTTAEQQTSPAPVDGAMRFNTSTGQLEVWDTSQWEGIPSSSTGTFVGQTIPTTGNPSAIIPTGTTAQQQTVPPPADGYLRFNTSTGQLEVWDTSQWEGIPSSATGSFASQTIPTAPPGATPNVVIPAGSTADRQTAPAVVPGEMRFNTGTGKLEVYGGGGLWETLPSSTAGTFVAQTIPPAGKTASAIIPPGPTGQEETVGVTGGWMRYNTTNNLLEFYNGTSWELVAPSGGGISSFVQSATPTALNTGDIWYDTVLQRESVWDGLAWVQPGVSQTGPLGAAILPSGTSPGDRPAGVAGRFRYSTTTGYLEYHNGTRWVENAGGIPDLGLELEPTNSLLKAKTPTRSTPPTVGTGAGQAIDGSLYWDVDYGALFVRYADANSSQWVMINGNNVQTGTLDFPGGPGPGATYAAPNGLTYTYDGTKGVWTCPAGAQLGLGLALNGGFIKLSMPVAVTPPATGTAQAQATDGSMYWDSNLGQLFVRYNDGTTTQWVAAAPPGGAGSVNGLGVGQTWQAPARVAGVTYTNTTSLPIMVNILTTANNTGGSGGVLTVDGVTVAQTQGFAGGIGMAQGITMSAVVPPGSTYSVSSLGSSSWYELR
jgi:hypothetical protein